MKSLIVPSAEDEKQWELLYIADKVLEILLVFYNNKFIISNNIEIYFIILYIMHGDQK